MKIVDHSIDCWKTCFFFVKGNMACMLWLVHKAGSSWRVAATNLINNLLLKLNKRCTSSIITRHKFFQEFVIDSTSLCFCLVKLLYTKKKAVHKTSLKKRGNSSASRNGNDCCSDYHQGVPPRFDDFIGSVWSHEHQMSVWCERHGEYSKLRIFLISFNFFCALFAVVLFSKFWSLAWKNHSWCIPR